MFKFRFNQITLLMTATILGGCASSKDLRDPANDNSKVQQMILIPQSEDNQARQDESSILVPQDMETISLKERSEKEELKNFENELGNENVETRLPANDASDGEKNIGENIQTLDSQQNSQATQETPKLSKEELTQQLFNADSVLVQKGDSLSEIAERHLGNKFAWKKIWALNPNLHNPNIINIGEKLYVPHADSFRKVSSVKDQEHLDTKTQAKVLTKTENKFISEDVPKAKKEATPDPLLNKNDTNITEGAVIFPANSLDLAAHTNDELLKEHVQLKSYEKIKSKGKNEELIGNSRKTASVDEAGVAAEEAKKIPLPKNLAHIISTVGILLLITVLAGFFFSKPDNNT